MSRQDRMKLSDVEAEAVYMIPRRKCSFEEAYPTIEALRIEVRPHGRRFFSFNQKEGERVLVYDEKSFVPILDCRNPLCYAGGVDLNHLLSWSVVYPKRTEFEKTVPCKGYEGSPKGARKYDECSTYFSVKMTVKYKDEATPVQTPA